MMCDNLTINQWNVRGLGHPERIKRILAWIRTKKHEREILCFQELKISTDRAYFQLQQMLPDHNHFLATEYEGKVNAAVSIPKEYPVRQHGSHDEGHLVWATFEITGKALMVGSVYSPNERSRRRDLWNWIRENLVVTDGLLCGDWNMVEVNEDSTGTSSKLQGSEALAWQHLKTEWDLIDNYRGGGWVEGPAFTRQARSGERFDQSRLDRCYSSNSNAWCIYVQKCIHDGSQTLSDHIPVSTTFVLKASATNQVRRSTYYKMDVEDLKDDQLQREIREIWQRHQHSGNDPRIKVDLAWTEIRRHMRPKSKEKRNRRDQQDHPGQQLQMRRIEVGEDQNEESIEAFSLAERTARAQEETMAKINRQRCRERWLRLGEAPTKYFFNKLKAKQDRESIRVLNLPNGHTTEDETEILAYIHQFYSELYTKDEQVQMAAESRNSTLELVTDSVTEDENTILLSMPSLEEVEEIVKNLPANKSPGLDGVTAELLQHGWEYMGDGYLSLIQAFWRDGIMSEKSTTGVIKLIPKSNQRTELTNWRPLTMLPLTEKIIAKLLANRLKLVVAKLVDHQQTGFINGRKITENLLTFKMIQDLTNISKQRVMFLKLDFAKAYDRVDHEFLWATMRRMNFKQQFIQIVRGLVENTHSKVHINGLFTPNIRLGRGVRQGCPLSPILFALSTQPLMRLIKKN